MASMPPGSKSPEERVVKPIEDAGTIHTTLTITFLLACLYFGITVASTTHRLLLLGASLKLPLLDVLIPLEGFYVVGPAVILGLHVHLLLQYYVLVRRLRDPLTGHVGDDADFFLFPALPVLRHVLRREEPWVSRLIRSGLVLINIVLPVLVLCLAQYYFLPYHSFLITLWHQTLICFDLVLIYYFFVLIPSRGRPKRWWPLDRRALTAVAAILILFYSFFLAIVPGTWIELALDKPFYPASKLSRNLQLSDELLISEPPPPELIAAFADREESRELIYLRYAVGARLQGRDLRYAELENAKLFNADLRGADLSGAWLVGADLRGAVLDPQNASSMLLQQPRSEQKSESIAEILSMHEFKPTRLDRAKLNGAKFGGARLILVSMVGANLRGATMAGLELTGADLRDAILSGTDLAGSELSYAILDGANLSGARLGGVTFNRASLAGATLNGAKAVAASFADANLEGTQLAETIVQAADFQDAILLGSDLRRASLEGATGLRFEGSDLRGAHLGGACPINFFQLTDLRFIDFNTLSPHAWKRLHDSLRFRLQGLPSSEIEAIVYRISSAERRLPLEGGMEDQASCLGTPLSAPAQISEKKLLYFDEQRTGVLENWPPLASQRRGRWDEVAFHEELAADLLKRVCESPGLARTLILRAAGEYAPGDAAFDFELAKQMQVKLNLPQSCPSLQMVLKQANEEDKVDLARQIAWRVRKSESIVNGDH